MRKRHLIAVGAALAMAAGGTVAWAELAEPTASPNDSASTNRTVILPTGDAVTVSPRGGFTWRPAEGRDDTRYLNPMAHDGTRDIIVIPLDKVDDIAAGTADPRRYNVSELLRRGETDAAEADALSDKPYDGFVPAGDEPRDSAENQDVSITITDHDGQAPGMGFVDYVNVETGESASLELTDGKGTVSLPPGTYDFLTMAMSGGHSVTGVTTVTVGSEPVAFTVDGTRGKPVRYRVDRPVKLHEHSLRVYTRLPNGVPYGTSISTNAEHPAYLIPSEKVDHETGVEVKPHLYGGDEADPYIYDLLFLRDGGVPEDLTFTAHDDELAHVTREFDGIATTAPTTNCNNGIHANGVPFAGCSPRDVKWQWERTEFLTPGSNVDWYANTTVGDVFEGNYVDFESVSSFEAGKSERTIGHTPLAFNVGARTDEEESTVVRDGDRLRVYIPFVDNATMDEYILGYMPLSGEAVVTRDGEEIGRTEVSPEGMSFTLPKGDAGRYTVTADLKHDGSLTPLATRTSVTWEFESKPTDAPTPVDVSAVAFDAEGVTDGYAPVGEEQEFTLEYRPQYGATDTTLTDLVFEVSYDDGKTWQKVDVSVDGDKASGTLSHPDGAKSVSVKATATDDAGNKVTHSTVHAYGLT